MQYNLRYPGQYFDEESGLHYNHFRSYDPKNGGRYTQADPIGLYGGFNKFGYVDGNSISYADRLGLATDEEIRKAVLALRCANSDVFPKLPNSIAMTDLGEKAPGLTDWKNNIQLNSRNYGNSDISIYQHNEYAVDLFLQTIAHEMLHVNEGVGSRILSNSFRMGNPLGYFHRLIDERAEAMITPDFLRRYRDSLVTGDVGCSCVR
ncbi:RHS repeat-associated core domain-containing protein [Acidovorax sp. Leaf191]|uniref:RHS repeat-associated core domain-containing protein n=1 Tax=Acidovorax sp. Leaf191 TaxID=1736296 RepID=UPI002E118453